MSRLVIETSVIGTQSVRVFYPSMGATIKELSLLVGGDLRMVGSSLGLYESGYAEKERTTTVVIYSPSSSDLDFRSRVITLVKELIDNSFYSQKDFGALSFEFVLIA